MRDRRVGIITYALHCGGMERWIFTLAKSLQLRGYWVEIVTIERRGKWWGEAVALGLHVLHVRGHMLLYGWLPFGNVLRALWVGLWLRTRKYEIVLLNNARAAQFSIGLWGRHSYVVPILHNDDETVYNISCSNSGRWNVSVCVSQRVLEQAHQRCPRASFVLLPYGVEMPSAEQFKRRKPHASPLRILYAGRLEHSQKRVLDIPSILSECRRRNMRFQITFAGDGSDRQALVRAVAQADLSENTIFLGAVPPDQMTDVMLDHHVLLMPSHHEGLPLSLLESMGTGCVPVVTMLPGITDTCVHDGLDGYLVPRSNIVGFASALARLAEEPALWEKMSRTCRQHAIEKYSRDIMVQRYITLFENLFKGRYAKQNDKSGVDWRSVRWIDVVPVQVRIALHHVYRFATH